MAGVAILKGGRGHSIIVVRCDVCFSCRRICWINALGRRDPLITPRWMVFVGGCIFNDDGLLRYFTQLGGLRPGEWVLDVGGGVGRMAIPLTKLLDERDSYRFDIACPTASPGASGKLLALPTRRVSRAPAAGRGRRRAGRHRLPLLRQRDACDRRGSLAAARRRPGSTPSRRNAG